VAAFQNVTRRMDHKGMNWNRPADSIPDGQCVLARNIRTYERGSVTSRPGLSAYHTFPDAVHSIARLNNYFSDVPFTTTFLVGAGDDFYVGASDAALETSTKNNPVRVPEGGISGYPLTMVDAQPVGAQFGWKYVGDSTGNFGVGYYPDDNAGYVIKTKTNNGDGTYSLALKIPPSTSTAKTAVVTAAIAAGYSVNDSWFMAHAITMGMRPPTYTGIPVTDSSGTLTGDYQWMFAYRNIYTGARSNPSAATRVSLSGPSLACSSNKAKLPSIPVPPHDPQTDLPDTHVVVDIYRFGGTVFSWRLVGTAAGGSDYSDNTPDSDLLTAPEPPQYVDPATGLARFNLYRPFVTPQPAFTGTADLAANGAGKYILNSPSTDQFDRNWLPGSVINIKLSSTVSPSFTIYQVLDERNIELAENAAAAVGTGVTWATQTGMLAMGQPLAHIWGPYGTGQSGSYVFGCSGDDGMLYWTNGNDPDSMDQANALLVTSSSEVLKGGCIFDGQPFVFSTERIFRIYPSASVPGQFVVEEVAGGKGLWHEWSLTVQSNGVADQSITWRGKDGIYDWAPGRGLMCLSDATLYPFFRHDNALPAGPATVFPFITGTIGELDESDPRYHRLCWHQGYLFYDCRTLTGEGYYYLSLVYDSKQAEGWVSVDDYDTQAPLCRGLEIGANNLKVALGSGLYDYAGSDHNAHSDAGSAIACRFYTRQDDMGEARLEKLFGDFALDAATNGSALTVIPKFDQGTASTDTLTVAAVTGRAQHPLDFIATSTSPSLGRLSLTMGLDITWTVNATTPPILFQWIPSFVLKPELTVRRTTDWTDDGEPGDKYVYGFLLEANTFGVTREVQVRIDGDVVHQTFLINHSEQRTKPYFFEVPPVTHQLRLSPIDGESWELFRVVWKWTKWPEKTQFVPDYMPSDPMTYRGVAIEADTGGIDVPVEVWTDGDEVRRILTVNHNGRMQKAYDFGPDIVVATEVKLVPLGTDWRQYPEWKVRMIGEPRPDLAALTTAWDDDGYNGAKWYQGFHLWCDTLGEDRTLTVEYDSGLVGGVFTKVNHDGELQVAYSFPEPFIAHQVRVIPDGPLRYSEVWKVRWIWEPVPELARNWITEYTAHQLPGWHSHRSCYTALISTADVLLTVKYDNGLGSIQSQSYIIPSTNGEWRKPYEVLAPMKSKWTQYRWVSCRPFRLFQKDCEMHVKQWGGNTPWLTAHPYGGEHYEFGARI